MAAYGEIPMAAVIQLDQGPRSADPPIHHGLEDRVRAHVLICTLAYYLTWHLKAAWKPLLFTDEHRPSSPDPVAKAVRSPAAQAKAQDETDSTGQPAHSYHTVSLVETTTFHGTERAELERGTEDAAQVRARRLTQPQPR
jgi:hypothetical protein